MDLNIKPTDTLFYDSPDTGDPDCICSRCKEKIPEEESPILRAMPETNDDAFGQDIRKGKGGSEYRFCWKCSKELGINFHSFY